MFAFWSGSLPMPAASSDPFAVGALRIAAIKPVQFMEYGGRCSEHFLGSHHI